MAQSNGNGTQQQRGRASQGGKGLADYDPDQDPEETKRLRAAYKEDMHNLEELAKDTKGVKISDLAKNLSNADDGFKHVKTPMDATYDSRVLNMVSHIATQKARELRLGGGGFDTDDFVAGLVSFMGGNRVDVQEDDDEDVEYDIEMNWGRLGLEMLKYGRRAVTLDFLEGPLDVQTKKRTFVKRGPQVKERAPEVKPQEMGADDLEKQENETTVNIKKLSELIDNLPDGTNLYEVICNPESFGQSVENLFYLSFLIRDGKVAVEIDDDDFVTVYAVDASSNQQEGVRKVQAVLELDEDTWRMAIKTFNIKRSLFPTRPIPPPEMYKYYNS